MNLQKRRIHQEDFWDWTAQILLERGFDGDGEIYSAGRSGGWLIVDGVGEVEDWDATDCDRWGEFVGAIQDEVKWRTSKDTLLETIDTNEWLEGCYHIDQEAYIQGMDA